MLRRFCGAVLFLWMSTAVVMTFTNDKPSSAPTGVKTCVNIAVGLLALIGLVIAIGPGKKRPPKPSPSKSDSEVNPPDPNPDGPPESDLPTSS